MTNPETFLRRLVRHRRMAALHAVWANGRFVLTSLRHLNLYRFLRNVRSARNAGQRVVILSGRRMESSIVFLESFVGATLAKQGAHVSVLLDDTASKYQDGMAFDFPRMAWDHRFRPWLIRKLLGVGRAEMFVPYSGLFSRSELADLPRQVAAMIETGRFESNSIDLWPHIESSLVRYYRSTPSLISRFPDYRDALAAFATNALMSVLVARRMLDQMRPDVVITSHGMYAAFGPFVEYVRSRGVRFVTYGLTGMRRNAVSFSTAPIPKMSVDDGYFEAHHQEIDLEEARQFAVRFMEGRSSGQGDSIHRVGQQRPDDAVFERVAQRLNGRRAYGLFPNVMWECESVKLFNSVFATREEWFLETVRHFVERADHPLIIRAHPAEKSATMMTTDGIETLLRHHFGPGIFDLDHIIFLGPSERVSSYRLMPLLHAGIVHTGTLSLELMYFGVPAIIGGNPAFVSQRFATSFRSKEEYFAALYNLPAVKARQEMHRELLIKYVHYYLNIEFISLDVFNSLFAFDSGEPEPAPESIVADQRMQFIAQTILDHNERFQSFHQRRSA
jgi:hypothetical protein